MSRRIVVVGDSLLDRDVDGSVTRVCPDAPAPVLDEARGSSRPGGAALAAAMVAAGAAGAAGDADVTLVTALGTEPSSHQLAGLLADAGVEVVTLPGPGAVPEKIRLRAGDHTLLRLDRGGVTLDPAAEAGRVEEVLAGADAVLVSDYGRGVASLPGLAAAVRRRRAPLLWDPHPRGPAPVPGCTLVTPNAGEALARWGEPGAGGSMAAIARAAARGRDACAANAVAVTLGDRGALLDTGDPTPRVIPVTDPSAGDSCGAGDRFAAAAVVALAAGALPSEAVQAAVEAASRYVAAGGAAAYPRSLAASSTSRSGDDTDGSGADVLSPWAVVESSRRSGGTVVATGGCFDVMHPGHVAMLQAARSLGDCLVVCLNSDRSVARLKGPGRPVNGERDRAATLAALGCVDAVTIFDEDTPERVVRSIRPDIWVKGGDYDARLLPEADALAEWGGQAVVVPYLPGHSTTGIISRITQPR